MTQSSIDDLTEDNFLDFLAEKLEVPRGKITMDTYLGDRKLEIDSTYIVELLGIIESDWEMKLPPSAEEIDTPRKIYDYLKSNYAGKTFDQKL